MSTNPMSNNWVRPVLKQMGFLKVEATSRSLAERRSELEESTIVEQIRDSVTQANAEARHRILDMTEFLPPSATIARVRFSTQKNNLFLEIFLRPDGLEVNFYKVSRTQLIFRRILSGRINPSRSVIELSLPFRPADVTIGDVRLWMIYLISGFKKEFKPSLSDAKTLVLTSCEKVPSAIQS